MRQLDSSYLFRISWMLQQLSSFLAVQVGSGVVSPELAGTLKGMIPDLRQALEAICLPVSLVLLERFDVNLDRADLDPVNAALVVAALQTRIEDELKGTMVLQIPSDRARYYHAEEAFGPEVAKVFTTANDDIEDAATCLACGQGTATVFHLMRVMEVGLKAVAAALGIPYAPSWESYLKQIADRIAQKWKRKGVKWKRDEPFFSEAAAQLHSVKVAWRNPTMHIVRRYNLEEAEEVFRSVRGFMRHLATRLEQTKK